MRLLIFITVALMLLTSKGGAWAQRPPIAAIGLDRLQHFSRDLTPSHSQDFFRAGQAQMEQEIRWLEQQRLAPQSDLLEVNNVVGLPNAGSGLPKFTPTQPREHSHHSHPSFYSSIDN